jgi:S-DNA-T family DNA segregation ATPase FtsK/SpoIIIE
MPRNTKKPAASRRKAAPRTMRQELKQDLAGIAMLAAGVFFVLCLWYGPNAGTDHVLGTVGSWVYQASRLLFGKGGWLFAFAFILLGASRWFGGVSLNGLIISAYSVLVLSFCSITHLLLPVSEQTLKAGLSGQGGGVCGGFLVQGSNALIGSTGSRILFIALVLASLLVITNRTLKEILDTVGSKTRDLAKTAQTEWSQLAAQREERRSKALQSQSRDGRVISSLNVPIETELRADKGLPAKAVKGISNIGSGADAGVQDKNNADLGFTFHDHQDSLMTNQNPAPVGPAADKIHAQEKVTIPPAAAVPAGTPASTGTALSKAGTEVLAGIKEPGKIGIEHHGISTYVLPPLTLLNTVPHIKSQRINKDITDNVRILEETLASFGVKAVVTQVNRGPSITRYELQPSPGVKVSRIVNLADDIALALAASHVRIEAPIPGKAAVGIEVPNSEMTPVGLREVLEDPGFRSAKSKLVFALGKDIAGQPIVADLAKMPHLLIAGSTGSGKSVCMNALIASILFNTRPDEVKMMMIDPKMVELSNYNGLPHLIHPVVTDAKKAATALRWAVHEMEKRYELFAHAGVKDIFRYNQAALEKEPQNRPELLPQIIILIDELADLMMVAPADVEDAICRLAQMARAAGMHLVVATQRPSVDVITGVIKANIPSRIAFAVSSQVDSRTILDMGGAERLLGRGDMLFYPTGQPKPLRVQGVYVSDKEIEALVEYLKSSADAPVYIEEFSAEGDGLSQEDEELDSLLPEAAKLFIESGQASISLLQRRLRIGYTRAARIIDQMEEQGIVGGYEGSKARTIRMTMQQYEARFGRPENPSGGA